jgi:hypothetical protein
MEKKVISVLMVVLFTASMFVFLGCQSAGGAAVNTLPAASVLYTTTYDGVLQVSLEGNVKTIVPKNLQGVHQVIRLNVAIEKIYIYQYNNAAIDVYDLSGSYLNSIAISIPPEGVGLGFTILPNGGIAILDNARDKIYFLDSAGNLKRTVNISESTDNELQNVNGIVVDNYLIMSEDGHRRIIKINLDTYEKSIFADLSSLGVLDYVTYAQGRYFVCTPEAIYSLNQQGGALTKLATIPGYNIVGMVVLDNFAYVAVNFAGKIYKVNLNDGSSEVLASGLNYPESISCFDIENAHSGFSPLIDGFQFSNNDFTDQMKDAIRATASNLEIDFANEYESSSLGQAISPTYDYLIEQVAEAILWSQKGYCGGMALTAKEYFITPSLLPSGVTSTYQILTPPETQNEVMYRIVFNQYVTQTLDSTRFRKFFALRLGQNPSGLVSFNDEVDWILSQLDAGQPVDLTLFSEDLQYFMAHAVLAYDYSNQGNDVYIDVYGPNLGNLANNPVTLNGHVYSTDASGSQQIHLVKDAQGNYAIANGEFYLEGFRFSRFGSCSSPIGVLNWPTFFMNLPEIASQLLEYLVNEGSKLLVAQAECPVNIMLSGSDNKRIGYDNVTQSAINEFENAIYSGPFVEPQLIFLISPQQDNYTISTFAYDTGNYTISISYAANCSTTKFLSWSNNVIANQKDVRRIEFHNSLISQSLNTSVSTLLTPSSSSIPFVSQNLVSTMLPYAITAAVIVTVAVAFILRYKRGKH